MAIWFEILHLEIANGEKHSENRDKTFYSRFFCFRFSSLYVYTYNNDNTISIFFRLNVSIEVKKNLHHYSLKWHQFKHHIDTFFIKCLVSTRNALHSRERGGERESIKIVREDRSIPEGTSSNGQSVNIMLLLICSIANHSVNALLSILCLY